MGRIVSPAGDIALTLKHLKRKGNDIVINGTMGVWEADVFLPYDEIIKVALTYNIFSVLIMFPVAFIRGLFKRKRQ
jgi:hypothetical protein